MLHALSDRLHEQAHVLARDRGEPLDAQDAVRRDGLGEPRGEGARGIDLAELHAERREVVVVVLARLVDVGRAGVQIVFRRRPEPEEDGRVHRALARDDLLHGGAQHRPDLAADPVHLRGIDQIGLVEHDEVRAGELLFQQLFERALVIERIVGLALCLHRGGVRREPPRRVRRGVHDRHDPVHRHPGAHARPSERLHQRLRQREPRGLDDDVLGRLVAAEQGFDGGEEVVRDGAADAAVGELQDVVFRAALDAAALDDLRVDADVAELVDDEGQAPPVRVGEEVADHAGLARPEESGDHGGGDPCAHGRSSVVAATAPAAERGRSAMPARWIREAGGVRVMTASAYQTIPRQSRQARGVGPGSRH